ncbi:YceD family protein [Chondromyces apiculatus]|uniref:DUF177 domain-containing protein n=1 Tax=Chondromyces apiculatus DSM 436 TaxID=1192034 RepID=A0A017T3N6_9BACT|nr:DUF177 domain-containing protein [Chondromyces apiculatus]EYF03166.1 Hypothetical protein CAP_6142 [Chondromyces apiculatus DSM 436]
MPLLSFVANDIDITGTPVNAALPVEWLDKELADAEAKATSAGKVSGRLSRSGPTDIVVRARVLADLNVPCARCLGPAKAAVDTEIALFLLPAKAARPGSQGEGAGAREGRKPAKGDKEQEYEFTSEEADHDVYDGEVVVLDPFVREAILLELPSFPLCSEACPGIRPAVPGSAEEGDSPLASEQPPEERPASIADLRDRFAQRSGRAPGAFGPHKGANGFTGAVPSLTKETFQETLKEMPDVASKKSKKE